ncbi:MAG TPA: D-alanine--D-alanine ligase [Firmicutes bacterium]|nr:D-alanine--D-alanine ligase [Bacillota bacterium]
MKKLKVGIIFGGRSGEHEVSLMSATSVLNYLDKDKYEPIPIGITKEGRWLTAGNPLEALKRGNIQGAGSLPVDLLEKLDVVFPVLHGPYGEDGTIQGLFEMLNLPYVGAGVIGSAIGMDKKIMKKLFRETGLPVVEFVTFLRREWEEDRAAVISGIEEEIGYPAFVKPVTLGSSVGVSKVTGRVELEEAIELACKFDWEIMVEKYINCREIECSVLGNDKPQASLPGEIVPHLEFYNYEAKYTDGKSDFYLPAPLSPEKTEEIRDYAIKAFLAVKACGMARVDFFLAKDTEQVYVNELNTIPGFTHLSMYPKMWEVSGLKYPDLIDRLIDLALERFADKQRNQVNWR